MILGIGVDMVEIRRIKRLYDKNPSRALERIYGDEEREYLKTKKNLYPHLAARFCAKEAFSKALGTGIGKISLKDFQVINEPSGSPRAIVRGKARELLDDMGDYRVHVSLSHTEEMAVSYVLISLI